MISTLTRPRRVGPLTDRGLAAVYAYRLREAVEVLDDISRQRLLGELRDLATRYGPPRDAA